MYSAAASGDGSGRLHQQQMQQDTPVAHTSPGTSKALDTLAAAAQVGREKIEQSLSAAQLSSKQKGVSGTMRRARMIITVQRTDAYKKWLRENPVQEVITGDDE